MTLIQVKIFKNISAVAVFTHVKSLWRRSKFVLLFRTKKSKVDWQKSFDINFYFLYITKILSSVDLYLKKIEKHASIHIERYECHLQLSIISYAVIQYLHLQYWPKL